MDERKERTRAGHRTRWTAKEETPIDETLVIRQRLRNLCELAIAIGQKKGLLGNYWKDSKPEPD